MTEGLRNEFVCCWVEGARHGEAGALDPVTAPPSMFQRGEMVLMISTFISSSSFYIVIISNNSTTTLPPNQSPCEEGYTIVGSKCYKIVSSSANYLQVGFLHFCMDTAINIQRMSTFSLFKVPIMSFQHGKGTRSNVVFRPWSNIAYMHMSAAGDPRLRGRGRHPGHHLLPDRACRRVRDDISEWYCDWWQSRSVSVQILVLTFRGHLSSLFCSSCQHPLHYIFFIIFRGLDWTDGLSKRRHLLLGK